MLSDQTLVWIGFNVAVIGMLALDLGVFHRQAHQVSLREAAVWSVVWVALSLAFNGLVYAWYGTEKALAFLTGYLIEKSLSVDNIFIFAVIFSYFALPQKYQHRVLFWGILGALIMRGAMIAVGAALIEQFHWILYLFGAFLVYTGYRMLSHGGGHRVEPENNPVVKAFRKRFPITETYEGQLLFVRKAGKWMATPMFLVLIMVETTDLIFALDSIPAIFAITTDPFIVYTSNVCAILGLRALYFLLANVIETFRYLSTGLAIVLMFIGVKMLIEGYVHIPISVSLSVVLGVVVISILASIWHGRGEERPERT